MNIEASNAYDNDIIPGSLSMNIEASNAYDNDRKATHDLLYRNKLLRTKKQKSIEGSYLVDTF